MADPGFVKGWFQGHLGPRPFPALNSLYVLTVIASNFTYNSAGDSGGALYATHFVASHCSFTHNVANLGGSISIAPSFYEIN